MAVAGWIGIGLAGIQCLFQLGLALGAPWGAASWGGRQRGALPAGLRVASAISGLVLYPMIALSIATTAGLVTAGWWPLQGVSAMWVLTAFFLLSSVLNGISQSRVERVWVPFALSMAMCTGYLALTF